MIYDCFMFNDELDLLDIRLHHHTFADRFVLIESTRTYSGKLKPLNFTMYRARYKKFLSRIDHIVLDFPFQDNKDWKYEHRQRDILKGYRFNSDDVIIYCDVDELLRGPEVVEEFHRRGLPIISLQMELCFYYLNMRVKEANVPNANYHLASCFKSKWHMGKILRASLLPTFERLYMIREHQLWANPPDMIVNAGWHFSNLGSPHRVYHKLKAISHSGDAEFADITPERIAQRKAEMKDPLGREGVVFETFDDLPAYVLQNKEQYASYFA